MALFTGKMFPRISDLARLWHNTVLSEKCNDRHGPWLNSINAETGSKLDYIKITIAQMN